MQNFKKEKNKDKNWFRSMARTKATVRRLRLLSFVSVPDQRIWNKIIMNRRQAMFKIKTLLPQTKQFEVKINSQVVSRVNVKRKTHYFSGSRRLQFYNRLLCFTLKSFIWNCKQNFVMYYWLKANFHIKTFHFV